MPRDRKRLIELYAKKLKVWKELTSVGDILRGSVMTLRRPCIYHNCSKCKSGEKHPARYYSVSKKNKTTLIYLSRRVESAAVKWVKNYRKMQRVIEELSDITREILREIIKEGRNEKK